MKIFKILILISIAIAGAAYGQTARQEAAQLHSQALNAFKDGNYKDACLVVSKIMP